MPVYAACLAKMLRMGKEAGEMIVGGLDRRFPPVGLMRSFAVLQPNLWKKRPGVTEPAAQIVFDRDVIGFLNKLVDFYGVDRGTGSALVSPSLIRSQFQSFQDIMVTMSERKSPASPDEAISLQMCWMEIASSALLSTRLVAWCLKWLKMAKIVLVFPVGSVGNERIFSTMNIVKDVLRNPLGESHLNVCVRMSRSP